MCRAYGTRSLRGRHCGPKGPHYPKYPLGQRKLRRFFAIPHLVSLSHILVPALCLRATMNP